MGDPSATAPHQDDEQPKKKKGFVTLRIGGPQDDHTVCKRQLEKAKKNLRVQGMARAIRELGCPLDLDKVVTCQPCSVDATGGFICNTEGLPEGQYTPKVVICEDNLLGPKYVAQTLVHELVHAYDQCRAKVNWKSCYHIACTEIRASALSGECDWIDEFDRGNFGLRGQHQKCVRRRAEWSLQGNAACKKKAQEVINHIFARCYDDTAPFDKIP